jgi:hypothetical protein
VSAQDWARRLSVAGESGGALIMRGVEFGAAGLAAVRRSGERATRTPRYAGGKATSVPSQKRKSSERANVFRFAPESRHRFAGRANNTRSA